MEPAVPLRPVPVSQGVGRARGDLQGLGVIGLPIEEHGAVLQGLPGVGVQEQGGEMHS